MFTLKSLKIVNIISFKNQEFIFRNGKAILIVGQNLDDSSQNGNGSGKSSLIEAIAIAFTGSSLRDVKNKELIHENQESGEVALTLYNSITGQQLIIWRKIYANTKSAEYKAWIDGKEQSNRYSDLNGFNAFVWETIGISKEDFFSFFLITKENYVPFLLVGDVKKKEIINRFSGADKVDVALPAIQDDSDMLEKEIINIDKELIANQTKQAVIAEQLFEEENKNGEEAKNEFIGLKIVELESLNDDVSIHFEIHETNSLLLIAQGNLSKHDAEIELQSLKESVELATLELAAHDEEKEEKLKPYNLQVNLAQQVVDKFEFTKDYDNLLESLKLDKHDLNDIITNKKISIPKVKEQFAGEITAIQKEEQEITQIIKESEKELKENEEFESQISKQIQDSIECPSCLHHFSLRDKTFNYQEAVANLPSVVII